LKINLKKHALPTLFVKSINVYVVKRKISETIMEHRSSVSIFRTAEPPGKVNATCNILYKLGNI